MDLRVLVGPRAPRGKYTWGGLCRCADAECSSYRFELVLCVIFVFIRGAASVFLLQVRSSLSSAPNDRARPFRATLAPLSPFRCDDPDESGHCVSSTILPSPVRFPTRFLWSTRASASFTVVVPRGPFSVVRGFFFYVVLMGCNCVARWSLCFGCVSVLFHGLLWMGDLGYKERIWVCKWGLC